MEISPIRTEQDYESAVVRIEALMDAGAGTPEGDELDVLATLVSAYEEINFPIEAPDPIEAIKFRMEQFGITEKDLEKFIGSRTRVWEILNRKRGLSIEMIRQLHEGLNMPYENLLGA